ncbi:MAG: hypothetical protein K0V04_26670 [Deltaproteobacteria bacterium]|nr:hypothetical protein [Deltaproteobacteria bacterium]
MLFGLGLGSCNDMGAGSDEQDRELAVVVLEPSTAELDDVGSARITTTDHGDAREPGYIDFADEGGADTFARWDVAIEASAHRVTIRYASATPDTQPAKLLVNGEPVAFFQFSGTGSPNDWADEAIEFVADEPITSLTIVPFTSRGGPDVDFVEVLDLDSSNGPQPPFDPGPNPRAFSAPSAATYSRLDSKPRAFARRVELEMNGNGHSVTWDGRIVVVRRAPNGDGAWFASVFRPESIGLGGDGLPDFSDAWSDKIVLESDDDDPDLGHNWLAITPDPEFGTDNPYTSDDSGSPSPGGDHETYKALVYSTNDRGRGGFGDDFLGVGLRGATFIVRDPGTTQARLVSADFDEDWAPLEVPGSSRGIDCIEPTMTVDSRLLICQGHPDNNGDIDRLVYSWTDKPGSTRDWKTPRSIAHMHLVADDDVDGLPFGVRYPIALQPLMDQRGVEYDPDDEVLGAYPWISRDGSELFYQSSREGVSARRSATTVVGRWTGWAMRHIDGPINFDIGSSKLFLSSPGAFTTMWDPFPDVEDLVLPYSIRGPGYPILHSNGSDYSEVGFDDYLDGNYVLFFGMNQQIDRDGGYAKGVTNDTSGHFNNGALQGASFPLEFDDNDEIVGRHGQAIYFPSGAHVDVSRTNGWASLQDGITVDMFVRRLETRSEVAPLFEMEGGARLYLDEQGHLAGEIEDETGNRAQIVATSGTAIVSDDWVHVAMTYDPANEALQLFVDGVLEASSSTSIGALRTSGAVVVGPKDASPGLMLLDEVKVSNVARQDYEIRHSANVLSNLGTNPALADQIPEHLRPLLRYATTIEGFDPEAAALGEDLFSATVLSKSRSTSCATCHVAATGFTDGLPIAQSAEPDAAPGLRNTPTIFNRLFSTVQGWSGSAPSLGAQAMVPISAPHEMRLPLDEALERLRSPQEGDWAARFSSVFGQEPSASNLQTVFGSFQALQFSPATRVDAFLSGDDDALSESERRGFTLFRGKARCAGCHKGRNYTDESFRSNGLVDNGDIGRADATGRSRDVGLFRVPTLRAVARTAPYMHDGSFATLRDVLDGYNQGVMAPGSIDTDVRPLELSEQELVDLQAFLEAL